ncbi:acyl-CoA dehydrogenase [Burkholderia sp. WAC0059]|nr:acyl-CoA dehydrogenase [Burkholderia sp. WAC0059]
MLEPVALPVDARSIADAVRALVAAWPELPPPGAGATLERWRRLAMLAGRDLSLAKIYEAHADALAILAELDAGRLAELDGRGAVWAVWAARGPDGEPLAARLEGERATLSGTKAWCSGAPFTTHALVTCLDADGGERLAALPLDQPGVTVSSRGWEAVGMQATLSVEVRLTGARATLVGEPGDYVRRPGFWHGAAGIAACWYGAAAALAARLRDTSVRRDEAAKAAEGRLADRPGAASAEAARTDARAYLRAHLGATDAALAGARALLHETAREIDAAPRADAQRLALRVRAATEAAAEVTLRACGRGLGAAPLCRDRWFARMAADLPVFVRQSHAESDLAALGAIHASNPDDWSL